MPARGEIPGLKKRKAKDGFTTWRWVASQVSRQTKGFKPRTRFLWRGLDEPAPAELKIIEQECALLNSNLLAWKANGTAPKAKMIVLGQIYFIADDAGFVKIGFSTNVHDQLATLQIGSASNLRVIGLMTASIRMEAELKHRFRALRIRGEWHRPDKLLLDFIKYEAQLPEAA